MRELNLNPEKKILILGASGMLGTDLARYFRTTYPVEQVLTPSHSELDATQFAALESYLAKHRPALVINSVAYTDVDRAEVEREKATLLNDVLPSQLAELTRTFGFRLIHFSTDYVFSGLSERAWLETDETCPVSPNHYAHSKLAGEKAVLRAENALVLRVQWLYGEQRDRFTTLKNKTIFTPFRDQFGAPTWTREIAEVVGELVNLDALGLYQFAYDDHASWSDVYQFVKDELGLSVQLIPKSSDEVTLPARRPKFGVLSNAKLKNALGVSTMGSWKEPLRKFLLSRTQPDHCSSGSDHVRI